MIEFFRKFFKTNRITAFETARPTGRSLVEEQLYGTPKHYIDAKGFGEYPALVVEEESSLEEKLAKTLAPYTGD